LLAELDAEDEMQAKKKEKNKKKKEKKKNKTQEKSGGKEAEEDAGGGVEAAATALGSLRLSADDDHKEAEKDEMQDDDVPAAFLCGLTGKLMQHPVVAADGVSYEGAALAKYIARAITTGKPLVSPATGESMGEMSLPNHLLRTQIEEWVEAEKKEKEAK
jgi:hypothetical protein